MYDKSSIKIKKNKRSICVLERRKNLILENDRIEKCDTFKYFGSIIENRVTCDEYIETRVAMRKQQLDLYIS